MRTELLTNDEAAAMGLEFTEDGNFRELMASEIELIKHLNLADIMLVHAVKQGGGYSVTSHMWVVMLNQINYINTVARIKCS